MGTTRITSNQSSPSTRFTLEADVIATEGPSSVAAHGRWKIRFYAKCVNTGGTTSFFGGSGTQEIKRNGTLVHAHNFSSLPSGYANGATRWYDGPYDVWVNANSDGYWSGTSTTYPLQMHLDYGSINTTPTGSIQLPKITQKPATPATPTLKNITTNAMTVDWAAVSGATGYDVQQASNSAFTSNVKTVATNTTTEKLMGSLTPAGVYWFRVRAKQGSSVGNWSAAVSKATVPAALQLPTASSITSTSLTVNWTTAGNSSGISSFDIQHSASSTMSSPTTITGISSSSRSRAITGMAPNADRYFQVRARSSGGIGAWSPVLKVTTLPTSSPGLSVSPQTSGRAAVLSFTPPGNVSGVTGYQYRYRQLASPDAVGGSWTGPVTVASPTVTVTGLVAGGYYEWQAAALVGTSYTSPWSASQIIQQPNPNTDPGSYFDGSFTATDLASFAWDSTAGSSVSYMNAKHPKGWMAWDNDYGTGYVISVTGGVFGGRCVRSQIHTPPSTFGFHGGIDNLDTANMAQVGPGYPIEGSIYVNPSVTRVIAAELMHYDASGVLVGATIGSPQTCVAGTWVRLIIQDVTPDNCAFSIVQWTDAADPAWAPWPAGSSIDADAAQITLAYGVPYFNGSFQDSNTYQYSWESTTDGSPSIRSTTVTPIQDPLLDPDCPPVPQPPLPPQIDDTCIDTSPQTWQRYWQTIPANALPGWQSVLPVVTLKTGSRAVRQVRIRYYQNAFSRDRSLLDNDGFCSEQVISYIPAFYEMTLDGVTQEAWASALVPVPGLTPGTLPANQLLYGTAGSPASWPELTCGVQYEMAVDVLALSPDIGFSVEVDAAVRW